MKETIILKITGMHCVSCAMDIDGELEDAHGVIEAKTSYAKQQTQVIFDSDKTSLDEIKAVIEKKGYQVIG